MKKFVTKTSALHIDTQPKSCKDGFTKPSRATSASESPTIMSVMDIPTNWRRWRLLRGAVKQKSAFTLAEVLITLGIIGIVSALTLPVLIQNINGHKYRNQFKKSFSTLSQAVKLAQEAYELSFAMLDQTCEQTGADANPRTSRSMCAMLNGTLKGATYVGPASDIYKEKDIRIGDYPISDYLVYRLSDGSLVGFYKDLKTCTVPTGTQLTESVLTGSGALKNCLGFIDVNGDKNPNDLVQGTSADSISWLFNLPTAYAEAGYGYGYDQFGNYDYGPLDVFKYSWEDLRYNFRGQLGVGDAYIYTSAGYNAQGQWGAGDEFKYDSTGYNAQGRYGAGDGYIYTWSEFESQAKYNSQGQLGIGDEYKYVKYDCGVTLDSDGYLNFSEGGRIKASDLVECDVTSYPYKCTSVSGDICFLGDVLASLKEFNLPIEFGGYGYGYDGYDYGNNSGGSCSASSFDPSARCTVPNRKGFISDIFPIVFHDGVVEPASGPARAVLHQTK